MNNKICNIKVEVPRGMSLNDKDYINSLLSTLKEMEKNYVIAMSEASNEKLLSIYKNVFLKIVALQREAYQLMFRKGWYCLEAVDHSKISEKKQMLDNEYSDMIS
mgnify:CR=1 FL=1